MSSAKDQTARFQRGYKTWAENTALNIRSRLKLASTDPLSYQLLGEHLNVIFWNLEDISELPADSLKYLSSKLGNDWSALTVSAGKTVVVLNPSHSKARQSSSGMHELSHILRGHEPVQVTITADGLALRTYDPLQEAEADWLAGCLLLPRIALEDCIRKNLSERDMCTEYNVSKDLYNYRLRMTGVTKQFARRPMPLRATS